MKSLAAILVPLALVLVTVRGVSEAAQSTVAAQLEVRVSRTTVKKDEPFVFEITLRNTGKQPLYVVGMVDIGLSRVYGDYTLWVRGNGEDWMSIGKGVADPMPQATPRPPSLAEFAQDNNIVLLESGNFIGNRSESDWKGTTLRGPGKYEIKVTYKALSHEFMKNLKFPFLAGDLTSNLVAVEITDR